jgi:3-isopropylmalate/(R)-2-methylmalate dehydratase small subunit
MERFVHLCATACPLGLANVDTDQLIPARFMKRPRAEGYGQFLLHDLRYAADGQPLAGCVLDDSRYADAKVLVSGRNFGTGSSREAAVYALWDHGIRCVIAPSFGDIFASNAVKNGLLPAVVSEAEAEMLLASLASAAIPQIIVDLEQCTVVAGDRRHGFSIDPVWRLQLLNGWDDLDLTERHRAEIDDFRGQLAWRIPWAIPPAGKRGA